MARREGSFTFTYSRRNLDIKELIDNKAKNEPGFVKTDYFCEAVRFYEKNKDKENNFSEDYFKALITAMLQNNLNVNTNPVQEKLTNQVDISNNVDLDDIEDDWLDED